MLKVQLERRNNLPSHSVSLCTRTPKPTHSGVLHIFPLNQPHPPLAIYSTTLHLPFPPKIEGFKDQNREKPHRSTRGARRWFLQSDELHHPPLPNLEAFSQACNFLKSSLRQLESEVASPNTVDLETSVQNIDLNS